MTVGDEKLPCDERLAPLAALAGEAMAASGATSAAVAARPRMILRMQMCLSVVRVAGVRPGAVLGCGPPAAPA